MKQARTYTLSEDIVAYLETKRNKSDYLESLVLKDMIETINKGKKEQEEAQKKARLAKNQEREERLKTSQKAWSKLPASIKAEIAKNHLATWEKTLMPLLQKKGNLTKRDLHMYTPTAHESA